MAAKGKNKVRDIREGEVERKVKTKKMQRTNIVDEK